MEPSSLFGRAGSVVWRGASGLSDSQPTAAHSPGLFPRSLASPVAGGTHVTRGAGEDVNGSWTGTIGNRHRPAPATGQKASCLPPDVLVTDVTPGLQATGESGTSRRHSGNRGFAESTGPVRELRNVVRPQFEGAMRSLPALGSAPMVTRLSWQETAKQFQLSSGPRFGRRDATPRLWPRDMVADWEKLGEPRWRAVVESNPRRQPHDWGSALCLRNTRKWLTVRRDHHLSASPCLLGLVCQRSLPEKWPDV